MLPWLASVSLVAGVLFAASFGKIPAEEKRIEPDRSAAGLDKLGRDMGGRKVRSIPSFQFTFDVGCQESVSTVGLDHTRLDLIALSQTLELPRVWECATWQNRLKMKACP